MLILLDTEFTGFTSNPALLSIGLITFEGGLECYAELSLDKARILKATEFVRDEVLPQFGLLPDCIAKTEWAMGKKVGTWLQQLIAVGGEPLQLAYDFDEDSRLTVKMLRAAEMWDTLQPRLRFVDIGPLTAAGEFVNAQEDYFESLPKPGPRRHHALADARAMRVAFAALREAALRIARERRGDA